MTYKFIVSCEGNIDAVCDDIELCVNFINVMFHPDNYEPCDINNWSELEHEDIVEMMVGNFSIKKVLYWE